MVATVALDRWSMVLLTRHFSRSDTGHGDEHAGVGTNASIGIQTEAHSDPEPLTI